MFDNESGRSVPCPAEKVTPVAVSKEARLNFRMLAFDYDETIATHGALGDPVREALAAARDGGWRLALVTGRPHEELLEVCPHIALFDLVVDENGGIVYLPASGTLEELAARSDGRLRGELTSRGVPYFAGRIVTITRRQHEEQTMAAIRSCGLDLDTYCNRVAIMVVPRGTCKARGFAAGLERVGLAASEVIAVGDDQNDIDFLRIAGLRVAVGNAIDEVKAEADLVLQESNGDGVAAFIRDRVLAAPESLKVGLNRARRFFSVKGG